VTDDEIERAALTLGDALAGDGNTHPRVTYTRDGYQVWLRNVAAKVLEAASYSDNATLTWESLVAPASYSAPPIQEKP
jgi:hypothetical protein